MTTQYHNFVGIDISKDDFYVAFYQDTRCFVYPNTEVGMTKFCMEHSAKLKDAFIVLENTGGYEYALLSYLIEHNLKTHRADARKIKSFIRSFGRRAKTDKIDAHAIAHYAAERHSLLKLHVLVDTFQEELRLLEERRIDLKRMIVQEKNRSQAPGNTFLKKSIADLLSALQRQLKEIDQMLQDRISRDPLYQEKKLELMSISGIGETTAHMLLALAPELGTADRRKIASLMGLAPHPQQSGKKTGYTRMSGGRRSLRPHLFLAAMAARRSHSKLGSFYSSLIEKGKKPLVALGALMRKIIVIANAKLRDLRRKSEFQLLA